MSSWLYYRKKFLNGLVYVLGFASSIFGIAVLVFFLWQVVEQGWHRLSLAFLTGYPSRFPEQAGFLPAFVGSIYLILMTFLIAFPVGIAAAIYLEEYAPVNRVTSLIEININNLAGIPSVIYGILGLQLFVRFFGLGRSLLAGALVMALLVLPVIILASREALRAVPSEIREGGYALGATRWQVIVTYVLPLALPGIMTGTILALSRALGETAPLITIGALTYMAFLPNSVFSPFTAMPIQIFNWVSRPQKEFWANASAGIIVLLFVLFFMNAFAIFVRHRYQKRMRMAG